MCIGFGVVLYVKCKDCKKENKIKLYYFYGMGIWGFKIVILNLRVVLVMIYIG